MKDKYLFAMFTIAMLVMLEMAAMVVGINGQFFGLILASIGGIAGAVLGVSVPKNIRDKINGD